MSTSQVDPTTIEPIMTVVYSTPATGATITLTQARHQIALLNPAGTLATLTVALPVSPNDGDIVNIGSSQIITALTITGTIIGTLTTLTVAGFAKFIFNATAAKWFRIG